MLKMKIAPQSLLKTKGRGDKDVKNADRSSEFVENKGAKKVLLRVY